MINHSKTSHLRWQWFVSSHDSVGGLHGASSSLPRLTHIAAFNCRGRQPERSMLVSLTCLAAGIGCSLRTLWYSFTWLFFFFFSRLDHLPCPVEIFAYQEGKGKSCKVSQGPPQYHFCHFHWPEQVTRPSQIQGTMVNRPWCSWE